MKVEKRLLRLFGAFLVFSSLVWLAIIDWRICLAVWIFGWGTNLENTNR